MNKWTKELDDKLIILLNEGKKYDEISILMNRTSNSVSCRSNRLGLKIVSYKDYICKNCEKKFNDLISNKRLFCSKSCSAKYNNKNKTQLTEETKNKIRDGINKYYLNNNKHRIRKEKTIKIRKEKQQNPRKCKCCKEFKITKKYVTLCDNCHMEYYEYYRPLCEFNFKIKKYYSEFNLDLVKKYGWYSPTNKRNNLNGVSKDHMYSVMDGFKNKINPMYISHPANCQLLKHTDNNLKKTNSAITLDELYERIDRWNKKYNLSSQELDSNQCF